MSVEQRGTTLSAIRTPLATLLAGAALALPTGLLAPSSARADCTTHYFSLSNTALPFGESLPFRPQSAGSHGPKPCSGPGCSSHKDLPVAPAPPPPPAGDERWGCALSFAPLLDAPRGGRAYDDTPIRPVRRAAEVYHPPRASLLPSCL